MAQPELAKALEMPAWKTLFATVCAGLLALLFLVSGVWKLGDPIAAAERMAQMQVPHILSLPAALLVGVLETVGGVLILVPRFRRWGALLIGFLLIVFMIYIGAMYNVLVGEDCSCFPWIQRAVGPVFFISDAAMLLLAAVAWKWAQPPHSARGAALVLAAVAVFAVLSYGMTAVRQAGVMAPESILVEDRPYPLRAGRVFLYFFNPECSHCDAAARRLARLNWGDTNVVGVSTELHQFGAPFMTETGLRGALSQDIEKLRKVFQFTDPPFAVALENGRQVAVFREFTEVQPAAELSQMGFVK